MKLKEIIYPSSVLMASRVIKNGTFEEIYASVKTEEKGLKEIRIDFGKEYENVADASNIDEILKSLKAKIK